MELVNRIDRIVNDIKDFFNKNRDNIDFLIAPSKGKARQIDFTLHIKSFVSKSDMTDTFHFELKMEEVKKSIHFEIKTKSNSAIPFHPHFRIVTNLISKPYAKWVDYLNQDRNMVSILRRMILSLQYNKGYIDPKAKNIGNKEAKIWYLEEQYSLSNKFPTDFFLHNPFNDVSELNITHTETPKKKIQIQPKKFNVKDETPKKKKFKINEETKYNLESKLESDFNFDYDETLNSIINSSSRTKLYISSKAKKQIFEHIKWGNLQTPKNKNEQGGILLGKVYFDKSENFQFGIVEQVVYSEKTKGSSVYLEMNHEVWSQMLNDADEIIDNNQNGNIQVVGWYHTHPNNLDVFMSGTDMNTQQRFFNQSWHYAIVLNPHKQIWKAFFGVEAKECQGYILRENENFNSEEDKITSEDDKPIFKKKDVFILVIIIALISTIAILLFKNSENDKNEKSISTKEKTTNKSIEKNTYLYSKTGDTIDIVSDLKFDSIFNRKLFVEMNYASFNNDSTKIQFTSPVFIKDSIYSEFGKSRDTLKISSTKIEIDSSKRWISFDFNGLIKSKNE